MNCAASLKRGEILYHLLRFRSSLSKGECHGYFHRDRREDLWPVRARYTFKDLEICALGCGAGWDGRVDLEYVNEGDAKNPDLKVLPIFAVPLTVNEEMTTTLDYGFDYSGSLHYGIDVHFHAPFKMNDHIETFVTQEAIWDRGEGRGSLSKQVGKSYSADGTHLCTVDTYDCCIYDGGWGGEQPPRDSVEYPDREPRFHVRGNLRLQLAARVSPDGRLASAAHRLVLHRTDRP